MKKLLGLLELIQYGFCCIQNAIYFRMILEDNIDRYAFFEELNCGWYEMRDNYIMSQPNFDPYNLSGRDPYYSYVLKKRK